MKSKQTSFLEIIKDVRSLPTIPGIIMEILSSIEDDKASFKEVSDLIAMDQTLTTRVLRLANSPFYSLKNNISTVSQAMLILGSNAIKGLVLSTFVFEMMKKDAMGLWEHALGAATAANIIARELQVPKPEEISTAALLHDIGKVIIRARLKEDYEGLLLRAEEKDMYMREAEMALLDTDHAEIGAWAGKVWNLPDELVEPIACHHDLARSETHQMKTAVVHLADVLIKASGFGFSGDPFVPPIQDAAYDILELDANRLERLIEAIETKLIEVKAFSNAIQ